ncbi:hypothetical protein H8356DRAFT_265050 [Neocallimastix lanati (nom. inval.)]|nr:hypothetical protein H8356DRAFT_265050 [Neocallimastix sp. JGI-2020a]
MSAEVMQNSEGNTKVTTINDDDSFEKIDKNNTQNDDSISDLKVTQINLSDLQLNDDSYLNSAIGKNKVFDDYTIKKNKFKYKDEDDEFRLADKIKTNININSASLNTLANFNSNNMLSNCTNLSSYINDGSLLDLKTSHQLSIVNSNTTIHVSDDKYNSNNVLNEPHPELTENSDFIDIDLEDKVEKMVNELPDNFPTNETELENQDNINQYNELDFDDMLIDDETILKSLLNIDNGITVLLNRLKQNCNSCKEIISFLKKRAMIEEEYGKSMLKLTQTALENLNKENVNRKLGSFNNNYVKFVKMHEKIGENHVKFSQSINDTYEVISTTFKNTERSRKQLKEAGLKYKKNVIESDNTLEKTRQKYEILSHNWDETLQEKEKFFGNEQGSLLRMSNIALGSSKALSNNRKGSIMNINIFRSNQNNPQKLLKNEDDARLKVALQNENYITQLNISNNIRKEYDNVHVPALLKSLKETNDECDQSLQEQLKNYSYNYESVIMNDATTLKSKDKEISLNLNEIIRRENTEIPLILTKCITLIENIGLETPGLYRFSGSNSHIQHLKTLFNKNSYLATIDNIINTENINDVTGLVKLFFRELPDPLLIRGLYHQFIEASKIEDERRRLIEIHELVNKLPDANYLTLRFLIGHLFKVQSHQTLNKMNISNLSIIWGPILLDNSNNSIIINPEDESHESTADLPSDSLIDFQYKFMLYVINIFILGCFI